MSDIIRILLVRHGESEGNVDAKAYLEKGDSGVGLTDKGWTQAANTGAFLAEYYHERNLGDWPMIHLSPHKRTQETLSGILHGMNGTFQGEPKLYPQTFLIEKFFGAASALHFSDGHVPDDFLRNILHLSKKTNDKDPMTSKHLFGESTKETMIAGKLFMETLRRDIGEGKKNFLVVCHGAVIQVILMNWMHAMPKDKQTIGNPGNGDVIEIYGTSKNWKISKIWDGENASRTNRNIRAEIPRFTTADLPPVPGFLKSPSI